MPASHWSGKTAIVCGASAGLGKAIASALASENIGQLILFARDEARLQDLNDSLVKVIPGDRVRTFSLDMTNADQVAAMAKLLEAVHCDLIVQAVGQSDRGTIADLDPKHLDDLFHANVHSSLNAIRFLAPLLQKSSGTFVLVGSLASHFAPRFLGGYAIVKHALAGLAQQARMELALQGIHVMLASPGPIFRKDAGSRYQDLTAELPNQAAKPGAGAKIKGLDPKQLASEILTAAAKRRKLLVRPWKARFLLAIQGIWPTAAEFLLRRNSG